MDIEKKRGRAGVVVIGVILAVVGFVWTGQGAGFIGGSFMTGQSLWLYIGIVAFSTGLALTVYGRQPR